MDFSLSSKSAFEESAGGAAISMSLQKARDVGQVQKQGEFNASESRGIYIRSYGLTNGNDSKPVVGTKGMVPCIAVAVYNPTTKSGAISHFDTNTDPRSLQKLMDDVGVGKDKVDVHFSGGQLGDENSHRLAENLVKVVEANPNATIKSADLLNPSGGMKSLALDTRTGEVYNQFSTSQLDKGTTRTDVTMFHASTAARVLPLRPEYINGQEVGLDTWKANLQVSAPPPSPSPASSEP